MISNLTTARRLGNRLVLKLFDFEDTGESIAGNTEVENEDVEYEEAGVGIESEGESDE